MSTAVQLRAFFSYFHLMLRGLLVLLSSYGLQTGGNRQRNMLIELVAVLQKYYNF